MKKTEIEVKLRLESVEGIAARLAGIGARLVQPRELEDNQLYDFPDFALKTRGALLRVRIQESGSTLTYKEASRIEAGAKVRDEIEVGVTSGESVAAIIGRLGMRPLFRYQKYRATYAYADLLITVDETPIGPFIELEGPRVLIDEVAGRLGYKASDYIAKSYLALYQDHLKAKGMPLRDMLFDTP
jgi:adenylate cyclase class 2